MAPYYEKKKKLVNQKDKISLRVEKEGESLAKSSSTLNIEAS